MAGDEKVESQCYRLLSFGISIDKNGWRQKGGGFIFHRLVYVETKGEILSSV